MAFQSALQAADYTSLRGNYAGHQLMALCPNTTVFAARVNQASFSADGFAQITYDTVTTGAYTAIETGQTVLLSASNDTRAAYWVGRVRKTPTSSVLYINETNVSIADNDYIFVLDDYRLWEKLARESGGTYYKDYDTTFAQLNPILTNLQSAYAGVCDVTSGVLELSFTATAIAATSGATISSYAWTIGSGMTVTAGSASTATVTIEFDPGWYWLKLVVTDSGARTTTRRIMVVAAPADYSSVVTLGFEGATIDGDLQSGFHATVNAFEGVSSVLDNTACVIFEANDDGGNVGGAVKFVGRLRTEVNDSRADDNTSRLLEARFTLEGTGDQLSRVLTLPFTMVNDSTPTAWDEINNLVYWRAAAHLLQTHSTFFTLFGLAFSDTSNDSLFPNWGVGGQDLLSELNGIAEDWSANLCMAPDGRCELVQRATSLDGADPADDVDRDALVTVGTFINQDGIDFTLNREHVRTTGQVDAGGGTHNTSGGRVGEYLSRAPGVARDPGANAFQLAGQVLAVNLTKAEAEAELNRRAGHSLAEQNPADELTVTMPDGYDFFIPHYAQWYTWTLDDSDLDLRGISYDTSTRWLCTQVSTVHNNETGTKECTVTFRRETRGNAGQTIDPPAAADSTLIVPSIPPFPAYPNFPPLPDLIFGDNPDAGDIPPFYGDILPVIPNDTVPIDGNALVAWSASSVWVTQKFILFAAPNWNEITPPLDSGYTIRDCSPKMLGQVRDFYVLSSDGTDSKVWYTADPFAADPTWTEGGSLSGLYTNIKETSTAGSIYLYGGTAGGQAIDVSTDYWLSKPYPISVSQNPGTGVPQSVNLEQYTGGVGVRFDVTAAGLPGDVVRYNDTSASSVFTGLGQISLGTHKHLFCTTPTEETAFEALFPGYSRFADDDQTAIRTASPPIASFTFGVGSNASVNGSLNIIVAKAVQAFPGSTGDTAQIVYSDDYGATFATPEQLGDAPGTFGGMDTLKIGDLTLAGYSGQVFKTTSAGSGADYGSTMPTDGQPNALVLPRYVFGSTSSGNTGATPEYLVASEVEDSSGDTLWKVTASGATFTAITPNDGSNNGLAVSNNCLAMPWFSGSIIAYVALFGSLPYIAISVNAGTSWTFRGPLSTDAKMVTFRKGDTLMNQLFGADGGPFYSSNRGATIVYKSYPASDVEEPLLGVAVYG